MSAHGRQVPACWHVGSTSGSNPHRSQAISVTYLRRPFQADRDAATYISFRQPSHTTSLRSSPASGLARVPQVPTIVHCRPAGKPDLRPRLLVTSLSKSATHPLLLLRVTTTNGSRHHLRQVCRTVGCDGASQSRQGRYSFASWRNYGVATTAASAWRKRSDRSPAPAASSTSSGPTTTSSMTRSGRWKSSNLWRARRARGNARTARSAGGPKPRSTTRSASRNTCPSSARPACGPCGWGSKT